MPPLGPLPHLLVPHTESAFTAFTCPGLLPTPDGIRKGVTLWQEIWPELGTKFRTSIEGAPRIHVEHDQVKLVISNAIRANPQCLAEAVVASGQCNSARNWWSSAKCSKSSDRFPRLPGDRSLESRGNSKQNQKEPGFGRLQVYSPPPRNLATSCLRVGFGLLRACGKR